MFFYLGGISCSGCSFLLEGGFEFLETFESCFLSDSVVLSDSDFLFVTFLVLNGGVDGDDFFVEETVFLSVVSLFMGFHCKSVLGLSGDFVHICDIFGGDTHRNDAVSCLFVFEDCI